MNTLWNNRNTIVSNLFNPAFCGEILRVTIDNYNQKASNTFPFAFTFLVLPLLLHKATRDSMPRSTRSYFFAWVEENDRLFFDFPKRTSSMVKYSKEALQFLLAYRRAQITDKGEVLVLQGKGKIYYEEDYNEYNEIIKKAEMLGKWLAVTGDVKSIYSFFRITP